MAKQSINGIREEGLKLPTLRQLESVWDKVQKDKTAQTALQQLKQDGFDITHLSPRDPTFDTPSWADYIAAIPLLENRPSRTHFHRAVSLRKHLDLVTELRNFARQFGDPFCETRLISKTNTTIPFGEDSLNLAISAASYLEKFLSWDWSVRERNPRNALIAELRWTIRHRTGKPHDRALSTLIDSAYRAAGGQEPSLDNTALDRIEKREKETRVKSFRRLNFLADSGGTSKSKSTRNPKNKH